MKLFRAALLVGTVLFLIASGAHGAPAIEIKGVRLDAPLPAEGDLASLQCRVRDSDELCLGGTHLTLAGSQIRHLRVLLDGERRVAQMLVRFSAADYEQVKSAFMLKYKGLTCTRSRVETFAGGTLAQEMCTYRDRLGALQLIRHTRKDVTSSSVSMATHRSLRDDGKVASDI